MSLYEDIPQSELRWLDNFAGKTGSELTSDAVGVGRFFLPAELSSRVENGKYYVVTLSGDDGVEVIAFKKSDYSYALLRGLDGTTPKDWPAEAVIYQSFTAGQLAYLLRKAGNVPLTPNDFKGNFIGTLTQTDPADFAEKEYWVFAAADHAMFQNIKYKTTGTETPAYSEDSGAENMLAIEAAGIELHPAAEFCANYREGGYDDWYLPASNELAALAALKSQIATPYSGSIMSSTCPREGGGNPSWEGQVYYLSWFNASVRSNGLKTLAYTVVPFRKVLKPS